MEIYDSEKEQIEALKRWWKENGLMVVIGLVVGLGGTFGWTGWQAWQTRQAESASIAYQNLLVAAAQNEGEQARQIGDGLIAEHANSRYAVLASLVLAKGALSQQRPEDATRRLQWVLEHAEDESVRQIAQFRLAQLAVDRDDLDGAAAMLDRVTTDGLEAAADELRGDIAVARENSTAARSAYEKALAVEGLPEDARARINIKLDDLGHYNMPPASSS